MTYRVDEMAVLTGFKPQNTPAGRVGIWASASSSLSAVQFREALCLGKDLLITGTKLWMKAPYPAST